MLTNIIRPLFYPRQVIIALRSLHGLNMIPGSSHGIRFHPVKEENATLVFYISLQACTVNSSCNKAVFCSLEGRQQTVIMAYLLCIHVLHKEIQLDLHLTAKTHPEQEIIKSKTQITWVTTILMEDQMWPKYLWLYVMSELRGPAVGILIGCNDSFFYI